MCQFSQNISIPRYVSIPKMRQSPKWHIAKKSPGTNQKLICLNINMLTFVHVPGEANSAHLVHRMPPECHKTGVGVPGECPEHHLYGKMDIIWTCKHCKRNKLLHCHNQCAFLTGLQSCRVYKAFERTRADYQSNHSSRTKIQNLHFHSHSRSCGQVPADCRQTPGLQWSQQHLLVADKAHGPTSGPNAIVRIR